ncbi:MAG: Gfo/Idh/MocA family oxidoreductase [Thermodesulfobacteriota bacterium]
MTQNVNVGLIGCGRIASLVYLNFLSKIPGLRLAAIAEPDAVRREKAGVSAPGAALHTDYKELLREPDISAVIICLPNHLHSEAAVAAFEYGKHVYLEKPIAINSTQAEEVVRTWKKSGLAGMAGFNLRFNPVYRALREDIGSGAIGDAVFMRTVFTSSGRELPEWKKLRSTGGGALLDLASHHIDLVRFILNDEITQIFARTSSHRTEDDNAMLEYKTSGGIHVQSYFSINSVDEDKIKVYGTGGKLTADRYGSLNVRIESGESARRGRLSYLKQAARSLLRNPVSFKDKLLCPGKEPSFETAIGHFASAVRENRGVSPDLSDGLRCITILEAAEESARSGRMISL